MVPVGNILDIVGCVDKQGNGEKGEGKYDVLLTNVDDGEQRWAF